MGITEGDSLFITCAYHGACHHPQSPVTALERGELVSEFQAGCSHSSAEPTLPPETPQLPDEGEAPAQVVRLPQARGYGLVALSIAIVEQVELDQDPAEFCCDAGLDHTFEQGIFAT